MSESRPLIDRCPGLTRPFRASDGAIVRVRKPGGRLPTDVLRHLLGIAERWGDGRVQVTTRTNLQVRGLPLEEDCSVPCEIADAVRATGLIPPTHELVRNVLCSPMGDIDLQPMVAELDEELQEIPLLEELTGRFMWAFDNGSGDVAGEPWDVCYQAIDEDHGIVALDNGRAWEVSRADAPSVMLALAQNVQMARTETELPVWHARELAYKLGDDIPDSTDQPITVSTPPAVGTYGADLLAGVPLGLFTGDMIRALPTLVDVTLTPWRQVLIPGGAKDAATYAAAGYVVDPSDPWASISACTGLPNCAKSAIDTVAMAEQLVDAARQDPSLVRRPVHVSGCDRRCGEPHGEHVDLLAPADLAAAVAELRA
ncbi:hypothetical protein [Raineyella fluvialis]|uniref:Nitrite/Sulfite reductase ferredoxin-like domain-containing protein n=1 Tax=Raineyella fluvialis TaxID=2662261 RepID=A0A5Q2FEQ6_9ACTN|nr:hypothetical protein [Raineyella fluvialis]QGF23563.1 hypothetical protein Rai3103_07675 [Raineyella fluvialis]